MNQVDWLGLDLAMLLNRSGQVRIGQGRFGDRRLQRLSRAFTYSCAW